MASNKMKMQLTALALSSMLSVPALATPTISGIVVSGFLKRASGDLVTATNVPVTVTVKGGTPAITGCAFSGTGSVSEGYFTKEVPCSATDLDAGTGALTAEVAITINGTPETFTIEAYAVPTALLAQIAQSAKAVSAGAVTNASIAAGANIDLNKLSPTGATDGDVIRRVSGAWTHQSLSTAAIASTGGANTFTGTQTFGGTGTGLDVTNSATIGTGLTVTAGGATVTAGGLTVGAGGAAITGNSTVTGNLNVTGTTTSGGALTVSAGGAAVTGNSSVTGTFGVTGATTLTGAVTIAGISTSNNVTTSTTTYGPSAAALQVTRDTIVFTNSAATTVQCMSPGVAGQTVTVIGLQAAANMTFTNNVGGGCGTAHVLYTTTLGNLTSTSTAALTPIAAAMFVSNGTAWYMYHWQP